MPRAHPNAIAERVLLQLWWYELASEFVPKQVAEDIAHGPLAVSVSYVRSVWSRFCWYGSVATYQGSRVAAPANKILTSVEHMEIVRLTVSTARNAFGF